MVLTVLHKQTAMVFVYWAIFNLVFNSRAVLRAQSSSIGVVSTASFPNQNEQNIPISGVREVVTDCSWIYAAAGSTSPGFYSVPNFGTFNLGSGNIGQANVGYNNTGFGNYGQENIGRLNNGNGNIGYLNDGSGNMGALNVGADNIGDANNSTGSPCIGYNNTACNGVMGALTSQTGYSIGLDLEGTYLIGNNSTGTGLIGQDNTGAFSIGFENENGFFSGNIGVQNNGDGLVGYYNDGTAVIGQSNEGAGIIGLYNDGNFQIGYNNTGTLAEPTLQEAIIGLDNVGGWQDIGVLNDGSQSTGFSQTSGNQGGTYIDTSDVELSEPIIFDPTNTVYAQNIGTDFNSKPSESRSAGVDNPFIAVITTEYRFNLDFPAILTVVDLGCPGDVIQVYDWSDLLMTTTIPQPAALYNCTTGLTDGDEALSDPFYSRNFVTISPGLHILTFSVPTGGGTALAFRVDSILPRPPCKECDAPIPPIDPFDSATIDLPDDFRLYVQAADNCKEDAAAANSTGSASSSSYRDCEKSAAIDWCKSKNFQMPRDLLATHAEAKELCVAGLGRPSTPSAQLEITSLLLQCSINYNKATYNQTGSEFSQGPWIGTDWKGRDFKGEFCLVASGEFVKRAKDCEGKRRFVCALEK